MNELTKKCPFCAEEIKYEAIKCKHCQSNLLSQTERLRSQSENLMTTVKTIAAARPILTFALGSGVLLLASVIAGIAAGRRLGRDPYEEGLAAAFTALITTPVGAVLPTVGVLLLGRIVVGSWVRPLSAYVGTVFYFVWVALAAGFGWTVSALADSEIAGFVLAIPIMILGMGYSLGSFVKTTDGVPIGFKKGFGILLAQVIATVAIIVVGYGLIFIIIQLLA